MHCQNTLGGRADDMSLPTQKKTKGREETRALPVTSDNAKGAASMLKRHCIYRELEIG